MNTRQKLFDLAFLEQMNDENFIAQVLSLYIHDTKLDLDEMKLGFDKADSQSICQIAHKLKSSTGMLQANILSIILEQIELMAKPGYDKNELGKLVQMALREFDQLKAALELHLQTIRMEA